MTAVPKGGLGEEIFARYTRSPAVTTMSVKVPPMSTAMRDTGLRSPLVAVN